MPKIIDLPEKISLSENDYTVIWDYEENRTKKISKANMNFGGNGGTPSDTVSNETSFGNSPNSGSSNNFSRGDHTHGSPTNPISTHEGASDPHPNYSLDSDLSTHVSAPDPHPAYALDADLTFHASASDPHTGYQKESEKGSANGYASLDSGSKVPDSQIADSIARDSELHSHSNKSQIDLVTIGNHDVSAHAPSNAQKNSDITKAEIEAKLTGEISTHTHAGGGGGLGYTIKVQALTSSPTDAQTVYFGMLPKAPTTTANISKIYIRKAGTIKIAEIYCYSGTAGSNEAWSLYIRKNNSADTLIATVSAATSERIFSNTGLSIAVAVGDYIEIKGIQPTWGTNPLTTIYGGYIYIE